MTTRHTYTEDTQIAKTLILRAEITTHPYSGEQSQALFKSACPISHEGCAATVHAYIHDYATSNINHNICIAGYRS